ncbi:MAG: ATP-binding protein [bacterium]
MLLEFSVGNYRSFGEEVTLSFASSAQRSRHGVLDASNRRAVEGGLHVLLSAAVFGSNASGKSNLFRALHFMKAFVLDSAREGQAGDSIGVTPFRLHPDLRQEPSSFEIVLLLGGVRYRYGFEVDNEKVHREWLLQCKQREREVFRREGATFTGLKSMHLEALERMTRPNALFLSVAAHFNDERATALLAWFKRIGFLGGIHDVAKPFTARQLAEKTPLAGPIQDLLRRLDLDLSSLSTTRLERAHLPGDMPEELVSLVMKTGGYVVTTRHAIRDDDGQVVGEDWFDLETEESGGTNKLFALAGPLVATLREGSVLVVDEFDARLHPVISRAIIELFHDPTSNPHGAQLLVLTHDTNLLDRRLFRRDQVWFVEKNRQAQSDLYALAEIRERNDAAFETAYLQGRYGAIPFPRGLVAAFSETATPVEAAG